MRPNAEVVAAADGSTYQTNEEISEMYITPIRELVVYVFIPAHPPSLPDEVCINIHSHDHFPTLLYTQSLTLRCATRHLVIHHNSSQDQQNSTQTEVLEKIPSRLYIPLPSLSLLLMMIMRTFKLKHPTHSHSPLKIDLT